MNFLYKKFEQYKKLYSSYGIYSSLIILINNFFYKIFKKDIYWDQSTIIKDILIEKLLKSLI